MTARAEEQVLAVPTAIFHRLGLFHGLTIEIDRYLPTLLATENLCFLPRSQAEADPSYKQIIPYVVLRHGSQVFFYQRGKAGGEKRLHALRSIGVGGHINPEDHGHPPQSSTYDNAYRSGMLREVHEEVILETGYHEKVLGLINDDRTPVGQVHLGIVHVFDLESPNVRRQENALIECGFAEIDDLIAQSEQFETWSQFALKALKE